MTIQDGLQDGATKAIGGKLGWGAIVLFCLFAGAITLYVFRDDLSEGFNFTQTVESNTADIATLKDWRKEVTAADVEAQKAAVARTLKVEGHDAKIRTLEAEFLADDAIMIDLEARMATLEAFKIEEEGKIRRAEEKIEILIVKEAEQRERAQARAGTRKVRDRRINELFERVETIDRRIDGIVDDMSEATAKELEEYRTRAKELQLERQQLMLEIQNLRRDLGDSERGHQRKIGQ